MLKFEPAVNSQPEDIKVRTSLYTVQEPQTRSVHHLESTILHLPTNAATGSVLLEMDQTVCPTTTTTTTAITN